MWEYILTAIVYAVFQNFNVHVTTDLSDCEYKIFLLSKNSVQMAAKTDDSGEFNSGPQASSLWKIWKRK